MMQKGMFLILVLILLLGFVGYSVAQQMPQNPCGGQQMMGQGQMGGQGAMGPGMGMMGQMMQKYGNAMGQASPENQQKMQKEMRERLGEILTKYGTSLKERAKATGK